MRFKNAESRFLGKKMILEELRKKALYQNSIEIWIGISEEKKIDWVNTDNYQKFIEHFF